jgi:capsular exopolysaccharide synthesis family protein
MANNLNNDPLYTNGRYRGEYLGENLGQQGGPMSNSDSSDDDADLKQIIGLLKHNLWLVIGISVLSTMIAGAYAFITLPIYQSDGAILVTQSGNKYSMAGSDLSNLLVSNFGVGMGSTIENELQVLRSRQFSEELAKRIHQERYQSDGRMYPLLWTSYPDDSTLVDIPTIQSRITNNIRFDRVDNKSDLVRFTFNSPSPEEAQRLVDKAIVAYTDVSTSINRSQAASAIRFLNDEKVKIETQLVDAEERMRDFMNQERLIELDSQTSQLITQMSSLEAERRAVDVRITAVNSGIASYTSELEKIRPGLSTQIVAGLAPLLDRLQYRLAELETERMLIFSRNPNLREGSNEPQVLDLDRQIASVKQEMARAMGVFLEGESANFGFLTTPDGGVATRANDYRMELIRLEIESKQLAAQAQVMDERIPEFERLFEGLPDNMIKLAQLKREAQINEALFLIISSQGAEMQLWEQTQSGQARIVDYGFKPSIPVEPKILTIILFGFTIGLSVAVGFIIAREYLASNINSIEKLRKLGYPLLAVVPDMTNFIKDHFDGSKTVQVKGLTIDTSLVMVLDAISPISESIRRLQANVMYSKPDLTYKTLLVTSSNKSEGKTTITANLAVALAESGRKVCIIDCDFRRPRVHSMFGLSRQPGLMEVLFDGLNWTEVMQNTLIPTVSVLTVGKRPPNPAEIIRSFKLHDLIQEIKEHYDHILIDSAPFGIIADAAPLIKIADGVILTVRFNQARVMELDLTIENLKKVNANMLGLVMMAFDPKKSSGYYYTNYYYKYAYDSYYAYHDKTT